MFGPLRKSWLIIYVQMQPLHINGMHLHQYLTIIFSYTKQLPQKILDILKRKIYFKDDILLTQRGRQECPEQQGPGTCSLTSTSNAKLPIYWHLENQEEGRGAPTKVIHSLPLAHTSVKTSTISGKKDHKKKPSQMVILGMVSTGLTCIREQGRQQIYIYSTPHLLEGIRTISMGPPHFYSNLFHIKLSQIIFDGLYLWSQYSPLFFACLLISAI